MSRQEFMERLNRLLSDIPVNERQEALNYYENYFEDAGPENEAKIVVGFAALGLVVTGIGMLMFTIGLLGVIALVWILGKVIPWMITAGIDLCRRLFTGKKSS